MIADDRNEKDDDEVIVMLVCVSLSLKFSKLRFLRRFYVSLSLSLSLMILNNMTHSLSMTL